MHYACDVYLPSTCFKGMRPYDTFEDLPHRRGYGVVVLKDIENIKNIMNNEIDWEVEAFKSTNSALNLRVGLIKDALIKKGYID